MPFALLAIGLIAVIAAYNNTQSVLASQLKKDFSGSTGFIYWIAAIVIVGAIGYIKPLQPVSRIFLALILIVIFLTNSGVFAKFNAALGGGAGTAPAAGDNTKSNGQPIDGKSDVGDTGINGGIGNSTGSGPLIIDLKPPQGWSLH